MNQNDLFEANNEEDVGTNMTKQNTYILTALIYCQFHV